MIGIAPAVVSLASVSIALCASALRSTCNAVERGAVSMAPGASALPVRCVAGFGMGLAYSFNRTEPPRRGPVNEEISA